ncbi:MAG: BACON domain-containing carbohydrate-binding protein, partial [Alistipes sp.]|nr:BACON domain-containing carbohydrate-binding protein [Alistipes sp.]
MNRLYLIFATVLLLLGCSRSDAEIAIDSDSLYSPKFYAKLGGDDARTYLDENWQQRWVKQDSISVFTSTANQKYKFDGETGDNSGTFSVAASNQAGSNAALSVDANFAVYPYNESTTITPDGTISLTIPSEQRYAKNSFDAGANQMVAVTSSRSDTDLRFRNLCGYLRIRLYGEDVTVREIYLHSNSGERISGSAKVYTLSEGGFAMAMDESANWHIRLYCEEGVKIGATAAQATDFWFVVPPVLFENGFQISVHDDQGCYFWHSTWNRFNIDRNVVESMTPIEVKPNGVLLDKYEYYVGTEGGIVEVEAQMPGTLSVEIPEEYKSWVSYIEPTRAMHSETVRFKIAPSEQGQERSCYVNIFSTVDGNQYGSGVTIKQTDSIVVSEKEVYVNPWGAWFSIGVRDDLDYTITIPEGVDWIHADENQDPNSNWRSYYVDYNESYESRTAELVVTNNRNNKFEIVKVTQAPRNEVEVERDTYYIDTEGGTIDIEARLTGTLSVEVPEEYQDWISYIEPTRALHSETIQLNIASTEAGKEREGNVVIYSENADGSINNRWITIRQTDAIVVGEKEIMIGEWGGTFSIGIRDGIDYTITIPEGVDWIHADENQDPNSYWRNYRVDNNQTYDTRTAEIVVTNRRNNKFEIVTVTQAPRNDIKTEKNTYYIDTEGGLINIAAQMVGTLSVEVPEEYQEWISYVEPTRAMHSETVQLNIASTEAGKEREGSIIIRSTNINGSTRSRRIYIKQTDAIVIGEKEFMIGEWGGTVSIGIRDGLDYAITIPEGVDWIHADENQDPNSYWRNYQVDNNQTYETRTAEIVVTNRRNNKFEIVTVTQVPRNEIEPERYTYYIENDGGLITFEAKMVGTLSVEIPEECKSWISYVKPTRAMHSETIQLEIAPLEAGKERNGDVIIYSENINGSKTGCWISIRQTDTIVINEKEYLMPDWGGWFSIGVRDDLDYTITIPEGVDWIHADENQDPNSNWRSYYVDYNESY